MTTYTDIGTAMNSFMEEQKLKTLDSYAGIKKSKGKGIYKSQTKFFTDLIKSYCKEKDIPLLDEDIKLEISNYFVKFTLKTNDWWIKETSEKQKTLKRMSTIFGCKGSLKNEVEVNNENEYSYLLYKQDDDILPTTKEQMEFHRINLYNNGVLDMEKLKSLIGVPIKLFDDMNDNPNRPRTVELERIFLNNEEENSNFEQSHKIFEEGTTLLEFNRGIVLNGDGVNGHYPRQIVDVKSFMMYPIYDESFQPYFCEFDAEALGYE